MSQRSTFDLYNRILDNQLPELLAAWRTEGASLEEIAFRLRDKDVMVTAGTVRRWIKQLEAETAVA